MNFTSRSETIVLGTPCSRIISLKNKFATCEPCSRIISLKNKFATCEASSVLWHGMKCAILEKRSTTTNIESCPCLDLGKPNTKSMLMSDQGV